MKVKHLALGAALLYYSSTSFAIECRKCEPHEIQSVGVVFAPSDFRSDFYLRRDAQRYFTKYAPPGIERYGTNPIYIDSVEQIKTVLRDLSQTCRRIKFLAIISHGKKGEITLNKADSAQDIGIQSAIDNFYTYDCVMDNQALIDLGGCNIARSCKGEAFMAALAKSLLTKGGSVRANYSIAFSTRFNKDYRPIDITLNVEKGPRITSWIQSNIFSRKSEITPKSPDYCNKKLKVGIESLNKLSKRTEACNLSEELKYDFMRTRSLLTHAKRYIHLDRKDLSTYNYDDWTRAFFFSQGLSYLNYITHQTKKIGLCKIQSTSSEAKTPSKADSAR